MDSLADGTSLEQKCNECKDCFASENEFFFARQKQSVPMSNNDFEEITN